MSVYKRGEIWWYKFQFDGQPIRQSTGQTSKRKAQEIERNARQRLDKARYAKAAGRPSAVFFDEAMLRWIETGAPKSMLSHARNVRPYTDGILLDDVPITANNMKRDMLNKGLSPQTVNRRLAVIRRVLNLAFNEWDMIEQPLAKKIALLSEKGCSREIFLNQDEVKSLVSHIVNPAAQQVVLLAAYTGLRRSEILGLQPHQWKPPYIVLGSKTKSGRPRTVPVIEELHSLVDLPYQLTGHGLRKAFETAREAISRPDIRFHDLRHTFASWLASDPDISLTVIRDLLGHSSLTVTSKYSHLRGDHIEKLERVLGTKVGTVH